MLIRTKLTSMQSLMPINCFLFEIQIIKNGFTGPITFRVLRERARAAQFHGLLPFVTQYLVGFFWNLEFSDPRFLKAPNFSNQKSFTLDKLFCNLSPDFSYTALDSSKQVSFPLEVQEIGFPPNSDN